MWEKETEVARDAATEAGKVLNKKFGKITQVRKKGKIDLVTEADLESEKTVLNIIRTAFPEDSILTEEAGGFGHNSDRLWIIDPLDGTTNFAHSFPFFAVSIALQIEKRVVLGIVYNPCLDEWFEAVEDKGAFLNNNPIRVSSTTAVSESLIATGFPYDIYENHEKVMELFTRMVIRSQGIRRPGSAAIDLCYVACGVFDGFWEQDLHPWDTAAGIILVKEAGGVVSDFGGENFSPFKKSIIAANPLVHREMVRIMKS